MFNFKKFFCNCLLSLYEHISGFSISGEISRKDAEISELKSEVLELKSEIKEKDNEITNLKSDNKYLEEQVIKNSNDFVEEANKLNNKIKNLSKANSELGELNKTKSSSITRKD